MSDGARTRLVRAWLPPVAVVVASQLTTLAAVAMATLLPPGQRLGSLLVKWDAAWYLEVAQHGYPSRLPSGTGNAAQSTVVFFPGYPMLVRALVRVTGMSYLRAGMVVVWLLGIAAGVAIWILFGRVSNRALAMRGLVLFAFLPGAFILAMPFSEAALLLAAAVCLDALVRERWVLAGLAGAAAGLCRPNGLVLPLCCAVAALVVIRKRREWRALVAPLLAPAGVLVFFAFLWARTGNPMAFVDSERRGWGLRFDFGLTMLREVGRTIRHPVHDFQRLVAVIALVVALAALWQLVRWRPPVVLTVYAVGILVLAFGGNEIVSTPRYVASAFPLWLAAARRLSPTAFVVVVAASAATLAALVIVSTRSMMFIP